MSRIHDSVCVRGEAKTRHMTSRNPDLTPEAGGDAREYHEMVDGAA